jgi:TonB family protein
MNRACKTALLGMLVMLGVKLGSHSQEQPKQQTPTSIEAGVKDSTQTPLKVGGKVSAPRIITAPQPEYSESARSRGYEGVCVLWLVVGTDGKPHDIRIARSLGLGLDEKAIEAVQQWRFEPAKRDGKAVAVQINVEVNFHLLGSDLEITNLIRNAERGDAEAQFKVSSLFLKSDSRQVQERGLSYLTRAANQGLAKAQFQLGERLFHHAPNNAPDYLAAYVWYALANNSGEKKANKALKELTSKMSPEQITEAQTRVANWKPTPSN